MQRHATEGGPKKRRARRLAFALLVAVAVGAASAGCRDNGSAGVERVVVVGVDGLDWKILGPLVDQGRVPNMASLIELVELYAVINNTSASGVLLLTFLRI